MRNTGIIVCLLCLLLSCKGTHEKENFRLNGAWEIVQRQDYEGEVLDYETGDYVWLRIYDDSCFYNCRIVTAPNGTMLIPLYMDYYTLMRTDPTQYLYLQGEDKHPLSVESDSTMIIQEYGLKYTWKLTDRYNDKIEDIIRIIKGNADNVEAAQFRYVFSNAETRLEHTNQRYIYILFATIILLLLLCLYIINQYKHRKYIEKELEQIAEEKRVLPEPVRIAINDVKREFRETDFYLGLRRRITAGERLQKEDWEEIEMQLKHVYPRFTSTLFNLHRMSEVEYRVCLLLKMDVSPSEIANILYKDNSSISSIRSRLYMKVFGKKGSCRDWDEFIQSL